MLCAHLVKNHPLKDGNAPVALIATIEFCQRNGHPWSPPEGDEDGEVTAARFMALAAEPLTETMVEDLAAWIRERMGAGAAGVAKLPAAAARLWPALDQTFMV